MKGKIKRHDKRKSEEKMLKKYLSVNNKGKHVFFL